MRRVIGTCQARDQSMNVRGKGIAAPGDMLIRTNDNEPLLVAGAQPLIRQCQDLRRDATFSGRGEKFVRRTRIAVGDQKSKALAEMVIQRRAIGEPKMRS